MPYSIAYTSAAQADLGRPHLTAPDEAVVRASVRQLLAHEPASASNKRRPMDPNPLGATWELRVGELRAYYDIDEPTRTVRVLRVGHKRRERVFIRGAEISLREQR